MKEILQTKEENLKLPVLSTSSCFDSCIAHVEHAGQDHAATEVGEAEEVHQEEEQQQFEGENQEQNQELTNFVDTQGKHRFMYPSTLPKFKFMQAPVHLPQCPT